MDNPNCDCCEGTQILTPAATANRPGLSALAYRVGTHASFLETMKARLSSISVEIPNPQDPAQSLVSYPLNALTTRAADDPAIALLDGWATIADVLTFYQERIANEGFLRTATERGSVLELARLIGYVLRPGVAASVFLALDLDTGHDILIQPHEIRAQTIPGKDELPQTFENEELLDARFAWNRLQPRVARPQTRFSINNDDPTGSGGASIYFQGVSTNLKANDVILLTGGGEDPTVYHVASVAPDPAKNRTLVTFQEKTAAAAAAKTLEAAAPGQQVIRRATVVASASSKEFPPDPLKQSIVDLTRPASLPPRNTLNLARKLSSSFRLQADLGLVVSAAFDPKLLKTLPGTLRNVQVTADNTLRAFVFRSAARPFGHNAPLRATVTTGNPPEYSEWEMDNPLGKPPPPPVIGILAAPAAAAVPIEQKHTKGVLYLDGEYKVQSNSGWVVLDGPHVPGKPLILNLADGFVDVAQQSMAAYGISGKATQLNFHLDKTNGWTDETTLFEPVRTTAVYVESEELSLADEPLQAPICDGVTGLIELDELYSGMQSGRWVIIFGERTDVKDASGQPIRGVMASELVMLAEVIQDVTTVDGSPYYYSLGNAAVLSGAPPVPGVLHSAANIPPSTPLAGDTTHTWIRLAKKLEYCYRRDTIAVYGNVLKATHGESRKETLGNGDASQAFQSFTLKQSPLTYIASPTPAGAESTLVVYVNDVRWHETDSLAGLPPTEHAYITKTDDASKTTVVFGNGQHGARLPTAQANVRAEYRNGIGRPGNVQAGQISLLVAKPLGVQAVVNPLRASGGADRESMDTARKNAPLTVTALDRLVSITDYADFARTFAGIGKSASAQISDGRRQVAHVTIAGADDIPIDATSDLFRNLLLALRLYGDPDLPILLQVRELLLLVISANIHILPDYQWDPVVKAVRAKLLDTFSFERRELGQDVVLSEVIAAIQAVRGVDYVDVDVLGGIPEKVSDQLGNTPIRRLRTPQEISRAVQSLVANGTIDPQQPKQAQPLQRVIVNLSGVDENGALSPAQLAYLTPDVADTLILNQVM